jgi:hypothetical protein
VDDRVDASPARVDIGEDADDLAVVFEIGVNILCFDTDLRGSRRNEVN